MDYVLSSQATGEALPLSAREWEMLLKLAEQPAGWEPKGDRDYTRGTVPAEEAAEMAESVRRALSQLWKERADEQAAAEARTLAELRNSLGYVEGDPHTFFGDAAGRLKVEDFVRTASAGAFEVLPRIAGAGG
jgi:hypothetical protein